MSTPSNFGSQNKVTRIPGLHKRVQIDVDVSVVASLLFNGLLLGRNEKKARIFSIRDNAETEHCIEIYLYSGSFAENAKEISGLAKRRTNCSFVKCQYPSCWTFRREINPPPLFYSSTTPFSYQFVSTSLQLQHKPPHLSLLNVGLDISPLFRSR